MAKGLFQVYVDPSASSQAAAPTTKSRSTTRKGLSEAGTSWGLGGKENLDPFARDTLGGGQSGKLGLKKSGVVGVKPPVCGTTMTGETATGSRKSFLAPAAKSIPPPQPRPSSSSSVSASSSTNDICTGTLRTRVLPTSLAAPAPLPQTTRSSTTKLDMRALLDASPESLARLQQGTNSKWTEVRGSPESAEDSGYARSDGLGETDDDDDSEVDERDAEDRTVRIPSSSVTEAASKDELNRRARSLTESPMADVTQAFTGLGSFSLPPPLSPTRRPTIQRIRSSPSHSASSILPTRAAIPSMKKPYAVPGNFPVPSSGPQPLLKKHARVKSVDPVATANGGRTGLRALRM
ncbi:hypothetical protein RQP46_001316 [Phenoliferia psychrophenolica]